MHLSDILTTKQRLDEMKRVSSSLRHASLRSCARKIPGLHPKKIDILTFLYICW